MSIGGRSPSGRTPSTKFLAVLVLSVLISASFLVPSPVKAAGPIIQQTYPADNVTTFEGQDVNFIVEVYANINVSAATISWSKNNNPIINPGLSFNYTPDFNSSGKYIITFLILYNGTTASHQWNLTVMEVKQHFSIKTQSPTGDLQLRELSSMPFSVEVENPANDTLTYRWFIDGMLLLGINETEYKFTPGMDDAGLTRVRVQVESPDKSDNRTWDVQVNEVIDVQPVGPQTIREGDTLTFNLLAPNLLDQSIKWTLDASTAPMTGKNYTYKPDYVASGTHTLRVNTSDGQTYSWGITVEDVDRAPRVDAGQVIKAQAGKPVKFTGMVTDPDNDIATYEWDFDGDGTFDFTADRQESTMHTYKKPGTYNAVFRVTDAHGETATMIYPVQVTQSTATSPWVIGSIILAALIVVVLLWVVLDIRKTKRQARLDAEARAREEAEAAMRTRAAKAQSRRKEELPMFEDIPEPAEGKAADYSMVPYVAKMADRGQEAEGDAAEGELLQPVEGERSEGTAASEGSEVSKAEEKEELDQLLKTLGAKAVAKTELKSKKASAEAGAGDLDHDIGPHMKKGKKVKVQPKVPQQKKVQKKEAPKEDLKAAGKGADSDIDAQSSDEVDEVMQKLVDMGLAERKKK